MDDGYSGVNFNRPQIQKLFEDVQAGLVETVIVKDLSRFGRNHLMVGYYTEVLFAEYGVRFISILDNVDSANGEDDLTPFKNILNEMYAKDISKKQRASLQARGTSGKRLAPIPPIGYIKDENGDWIIDETRADLVRRIYQLYLSDQSITEIAETLTKEKIPTAWGKANWYPSQIKRILTCQEYCGDMVNFKLRRISFKNKKQVPVDPAERKVFPNMQPAIIDRNQWQLVQDKMKRIQRKHPNMKHGPAVFKGFLYCGECGCKCYARQSKDHYVLHYVCSGYARNTSSCTIHYISDNILRRRVLKTLRSLLDQFRKDEAAFITRLQGFRQNTWKTEITEKQRTIDRLHSEIFDLERKLRKVFDDKNTGIVSDAAFQILSDQIIEERKSLLKISEQLEKEVQEMRSSSVQIQSFIDVLKKYRDTDVTEITQTLLLDFVDKILIHDSDAKYEYTQQKKIDIYLRAVGCIDMFTK